MTKRFNTNLKHIVISTIALLVMILFSSCGKNITFQNSNIVPAAEGKVSIKKDSNKNYSVKIKISNLAEVKRLQPSKNVYIVWMETEDNGVKNIGQIKSDTGFMSSKLKASFETVTSFTPTKVFITAEDHQDAKYPGNQIVLTTKSF